MLVARMAMVIIKFLDLLFRLFFGPGSCDINSTSNHGSLPLSGETNQDPLVSFWP